MSSGENLQEMEVGTAQSKTAVNSGAKSADPMPSAGSNASGVSTPGQTGSWEDLGGPTPENYKSDDDSAKFKEPSLKTVNDVVKRGAKPAEPMQKLTGAVKEEEEIDDEVISEDDEVETEEDQDFVSEEEVEEEEEAITEEEYDIEEDVNAILETDEVELSEEFKEKAKLVFESALKTKVGEIQEALEIRYEERLAEEVAEIKEALQERVDSYLEYVADEWIAENQLSVEQGLKEELSESFMSGLRDLFEAHYVHIPEDKYDVLDSMTEKLDEMETKLNEQIEKNVSLNKRLAESVADGIFDDIAEGLAFSQKEKLASLAESVEFGSETEYREKLVALKESYFPTKNANHKVVSENLSEEVETPEAYSKEMDAYLAMVNKIAKN
jgi:hypothetical protein